MHAPTVYSSIIFCGSIVHTEGVEVNALHSLSLHTLGGRLTGAPALGSTSSNWAAASFSLASWKGSWQSLGAKRKKPFNA